MLVACSLLPFLLFFAGMKTFINCMT